MADHIGVAIDDVTRELKDMNKKLDMLTAAE